MEEFKEYLTVTEVMKILKLSRPTVIEMIKRDELIGGRFGDHFKVEKEGLKKYISNCMESK